jgi:hypothetical protein
MVKQAMVLWRESVSGATEVRPEEFEEIQVYTGNL